MARGILYTLLAGSSPTDGNVQTQLVATSVSNLIIYCTQVDCMLVHYTWDLDGLNITHVLEYYDYQLIAKSLI